MKAVLSREPSTEPTSPYDSHPPLAERVARIEALPDDGRAGQAARPALELLADANAALTALEQAVLTSQALALKRVDWEDLVHESMTVYADQGAQEIREACAAEGAGPGLVTLLDAIDADPAVRWRIADRFPKSEQAAAATGDAARGCAIRRRRGTRWRAIPARPGHVGLDALAAQHPRTRGEFRP
ncbi:hypothetical protein [Streptomyces sp. NPDC023838]|uniref:hypothetical protein n=1 Tax=Streptomyces sp. NPDC023838 TaxID=3154325 RepID=UPI0033FA5952